MARVRLARAPARRTGAKNTDRSSQAREPPIGVLDTITMPVRGRPETGMLRACCGALLGWSSRRTSLSGSSFSASVACEVDRAEGGRKGVEHARRPL